MLNVSHVFSMMLTRGVRGRGGRYHHLECIACCADDFQLLGHVESMWPRPNRYVAPQNVLEGPSRTFCGAT